MNKHQHAAVATVIQYMIFVCGSSQDVEWLDLISRVWTIFSNIICLRMELTIIADCFYFILLSDFYKSENQTSKVIINIRNDDWAVIFVSTIRNERKSTKGGMDGTMPHIL